MHSNEIISKLTELAARKKLFVFARWAGIPVETLSRIVADGEGRVISKRNTEKLVRAFAMLDRHGEEFAFQKKRDLPTALALTVDEWHIAVDYYFSTTSGELVEVYPNGAKRVFDEPLRYSITKEWRGADKRVYRSQWQEVRDALGFN